MRSCLLAFALLALPSVTRAADVQVYLAGDDPDDLVEVLELARSAKHRLWVFAYTLSDAALVELLSERAAQPAFDLRVVMDAQQHAKNKAQLALLGSRLSPLEVPDNGRMHIKLMLIDDHTVVMGSKNWSDLANQLKWNDVVVIRDAKRHVSLVEKAFQRLGGFEAGDLPRLAAPEAPAAERARVELLFSAPGNPGARARATLLALVSRARRRIFLGQFILSDPELIKAIWLRREQVELRVVVDAIQYGNLTKRVDAGAKQLLRQLGDLGPALRTTSSKQLHHKLALIDDVVITGSANWSKAAWEKNHEALAILRPERRQETPAFVERYRERLARLWEAGTPP